MWYGVKLTIYRLPNLSMPEDELYILGESWENVKQRAFSIRNVTANKFKRDYGYRITISGYNLYLENSSSPELLIEMEMLGAISEEEAEEIALKKKCEIIEDLVFKGVDEK